MAVASAGPYASLHLAPCQHRTTQFFTGPTNSIKSLKAQTLKAHLILWCYTNMFIIVVVIYYEIKMSRDALRPVEELVMT